MAYQIPTVAEIDRKLRQDFRDRLHDFGVSGDATDPTLAVLFRTLAGRLEGLYAETGGMRLALLDELIGGLGVEQRRARAAQTVVRFQPERPEPVWIEAGTELTGEADSGERMTFAVDAPVEVSGARIALALAYQDGGLRMLSGVEASPELQDARPSLDPAPADLGPQPALYLAIENLPPRHLSRQGFFFTLGPDADALREALLRETWCLADADGALGGQGVLRPRRGNAGVRELHWLTGAQAWTEESETPQLPDGFYAGRVFTLPEVPAERRFLCQQPRGMAEALRRILGPSAAVLLDRPRAWLKISLPCEVPALDVAVSSITMNSITASNVECFNQTVKFERDGVSIPVSREAGAAKHLIAPLAVFGDDERGYLPELEPAGEPGAGRYCIHNGRIEIQPGRRPDGREDAYANLRMWLTAGKAGNSVGPGKIQSFLKTGAAPAVRVINPTAAAGGRDAETIEEARGRFSATIRSGQRAVTRGDIEAIVRSFEPRVVKVESESAAVRGEGGGLQRAQRVICHVERDRFVDPKTEGPALERDLEGHLSDRLLFDTALELELRWR